MIKRTVIYICLLLFFASCEKNDYVAKFSYSVDGENFTVKGGGLEYAERFKSGKLKTVMCYPMLHADLKGKGKGSMMDTSQSYRFFITDTTGGKQRIFYVQNGKELTNFTLTYKGNLYWAISGFIQLNKENAKKVKNMEVRGIFEAVMVSYPLDLPTDTIIVKNGSFHFSKVSYSSGDSD